MPVKGADRSKWTRDYGVVYSVLLHVSSNGVGEEQEPYAFSHPRDGIPGPPCDAFECCLSLGRTLGTPGREVPSF